MAKKTRPPNGPSKQFGNQSMSYVETKMAHAGLPPGRSIEVSGPWPLTITSMHVSSNRLERLFTDHFEMFLPTRTVTLYEITGDMGRQTFQYRTGMVAFNPPNENWSIEWEGTIEGVSILFDDATIEEAIRESFSEDPKTLSWRLALGDHAPAIAYLGLDIASQAATGYPAGKEHTEQLIGTFLSMIIRRYSVTPDRDTALVGVMSPQVIRTVQYINLNLHRHLTLQELCDVGAASLAHMNRLFRAELGESVWNYVQRRRLIAVAEQLLSSDDPIPKIARNCGYNSLSNFFRHFKLFYGVTPAAYRETQQVTGQ